MKILRIFGIVAAVHLVAFMFIMANPGCSTKSKGGASMAAAGEGPQPTIGGDTPESGTGDQSAPQQAGPVSQSVVPDEGGISFDPNAIARGRQSAPTRPEAAGRLVSQQASERQEAQATVTVGKGDSLWSLAKKNKVQVTDLAAANNLKTSAVLQVGQKLVLPRTGAPAASPVADSRGSSRSTVAQKTSVSAAPEASTQADSAPVKANGNGKGGYVTHVVKPGEMLGSIARKYGVKAADIAVANHITNPAMIPSGKELRIPMPKSKTSGTTKAEPVEARAKSESAKPARAEPVEAPAKSNRPILPVIGEGMEDLDSGLAPSATGNTPVLQLDDEPAR